MTGPHGDTRAPFCTRVEYELHVGVIERYVILFCQLTKWPHKNTLCDACFARIPVREYKPVRLLVLIHNSMPFPNLHGIEIIY